MHPGLPDALPTAPVSYSNYPLKRLGTLRLWWLFTGFLGGHRYYMGLTGTAALMTLTYGGGLIWWGWDGFRLKHMLGRHNAAQLLRQQLGHPPLELAFLPPPGAQPAPQRRSSLLPAALLVFMLSSVVSVLAIQEGLHEVLTALIALLLLFNFAGVLRRYTHLIILQDLFSWYNTLLLYHRYAPQPGTAGLFVRSFTGLFIAPFKARWAQEVQLYLQLGGVFTGIFTVLSLVDAELWHLALRGDYSTLVRGWFLGSVASFFLVTTCLVPLGAIYAREALGNRPPWRRWVLTVAALLGMWAVLSPQKKEVKPHLSNVLPAKTAH